MGKKTYFVLSIAHGNTRTKTIALQKAGLESLGNNVITCEDLGEKRELEFTLGPRPTVIHNAEPKEPIVTKVESYSGKGLLGIGLQNEKSRKQIIAYLIAMDEAKKVKTKKVYNPNQVHRVK